MLNASGSCIYNGRMTRSPSSKIAATNVSRRPGGRTAQTTQKVLDAVCSLLGQVTPDQLTVGMVAKTAGVNEATIYRKWGGKDALLADALLKISDTKLPVVDTGSLQADFSKILESIVKYLQTPEGLALLKFGAQAEYPRIQELRETFWSDRLRKMETLLRQAEARGDITHWENGLIVYEMAVALIHFKVLERGERVSEADLRHSVEMLKLVLKYPQLL